jgi:serine/threonine protein kinase
MLHGAIEALKLYNNDVVEKGGAMSNLIGQSLDRYHILEQLGEGGMAVVYKAYDTHLDRPVAVKVILPGFEHSEKFLKRFEREARALAKLFHPNIVRVLDYGQHNGLPYLVMEYLPGGTLKKKQGQPLPWQEAARLLAPVARALAYAHQQGILHRDVKPSNILITQSGEPMLSDFGLAKILESQDVADITGSTGVVGTPAYMAPEQITGNKVDQRVDIYALGIVFYELVTGRPPYRADTPAAVMIKAATEPLPRPTQFVPDLPDKVEQVILKALQKDVENRFQNMDELALALERFAADREPVSATISSTIVVQPSPSTDVPSSTLTARPAPSAPQKVIETPRKRSRLPGWAIAGGGMIGLLLIVGIVAGIYNLTGGYGVRNVETATPSPTAILRTPTKFPTPVHTSTPMPVFTPMPLPILVEPYQPQAGDNYPTLRQLTPGWKAAPGPGVQTWNISVNANQPAVISDGWCTTTKEILDQNFQHLTYIVELDGLPLDLKYLNIVDEQSAGSACKKFFGIIRNWPEGNHVVRIIWHLETNLNDGTSDIPAGEIVNVYNVTVLPPK